MFGQIVRFELRYTLRQPSTYVYLAVFMLMAVFDFCTAAARAGVQVKANSPFIIARSTGALSLFGLFVPLAIAANAALRDAQSKMDVLIRATPVGAATYLLGRFT